MQYLNTDTLTEIPDYMAGVTVGQILAFMGGASVIIGGLWLLLRPVFRGVREVYRSITDLSGRPERLDAAGNLVEEAQPSLRASIHALHAKDEETTAILNEVREQVSNTHSTNLRDDLDRLHHDVRGIREDLSAEVRGIKAEYNANHAEGLAQNRATRQALETQSLTTKKLADLAELWGPYLREQGLDPEK